ncbi:putative nudC protein [Mrakia frigida]|uniref:NudC domain-containing protein n=1 Tax=Mrakia frigida TaxID=29902 RepID=UPI003FCC14B8
MTPDEQKVYDALTPTEQASFDAAARDKEAAEQATLPYKWTQDLATVTLTLDVPTGTRAKDLAVELKRTAIKGGLKGKEPAFSGSLFAPIKEEDSTWSIADSILTLELYKSNDQQWWPHVLTHHPKLDTTKLTPENSKLSDLDGEMRGVVEKMMFDNQQKQMGKPTSDELKKQEALKNFAKMHPEMDLSKVQMS